MRPDPNDYSAEIEALNALHRFKAGIHPDTIAKGLSPAGREFIGWPEATPELRKAPLPVPTGNMDTMHGLADAARRRQAREAAQQFAELRQGLSLLSKSMSNARNRREAEAKRRCVTLYKSLRRDLLRDAKRGDLPPEIVAARESALTGIATRMHAAGLI